MPINFDKALCAFPEHLSLYGKRSTLLASNLANADTPGFRARDLAPFDPGQHRGLAGRTGTVCRKRRALSVNPDFPEWQIPRLALGDKRRVVNVLIQRV